MLVVDVNVLWEVTELGRLPGTAAAVARRDPVWTAPRFWESEARNICATLMRANRLSLVAAIAAIEDIRGFLDGEDHIPDSPRILELADGSGCAAYDCEYVALAESLGVPLVTFDRTHLRAFPAIATSPEDFLARPS